MEAEEWSESLRSRAPWVFEGKTVRETLAESEMERKETPESLRSSQEPRAVGLGGENSL